MEHFKFIRIASNNKFNSLPNIFYCQKMSKYLRIFMYFAINQNNN